MKANSFLLRFFCFYIVYILVSWEARAFCRSQHCRPAILKMWSASLGNFQKCALSGIPLQTDSLSQQVWGWGPAVCSVSSLGDSDAGHSVTPTVESHASRASPNVFLYFLQPSPCLLPCIVSSLLLTKFLCCHDEVHSGHSKFGSNPKSEVLCRKHFSIMRQL